VTASWCCGEAWLATTRSANLRANFMRLTREKVIRLSHQITEVLVKSEEVEFVEDRDTIRQQIVQILTATLKDEEKADAEVRKRITSQKKEILEGSEEWDVLYRKYYADELRRMGIAAAPDDRRERRQ
jgi:hypothetical protein